MQSLAVIDKVPMISLGEPPGAEFNSEAPRYRCANTQEPQPTPRHVVMNWARRLK
jgi:hypothetical protein